MKQTLLFLTVLILSTTLFAQVPTITSFTPSSAKPGDAVTITGTNFNTTTTNNVVFFGATRATVTAATATSLTVTVPIGATYDGITVLNLETGLIVQALNKFNPIYSPAKSNINTSTFSSKIDFSTDIDINENHNKAIMRDIDGDGKPDIVVSMILFGRNRIVLLRNTSTNGVLSFSAPIIIIDTGDYGKSFTLADLDGNGKLDILATARNYTFEYNVIQVVKNNSTIGSIDFSSPVFLDLDLAASSPITVVNTYITTGDLDGDGKPEVLAGNTNTNLISVFRNTTTGGNLSFQPYVDFSSGGRTTSLALADFDGDSKLDIVSVNNNSNTVSVLRNTSNNIGQISFAGFADFTVGTAPFEVVTGDVDGDGKIDLAVANKDSGNLSLLRNTSSFGNISFDTKVDFTTGINTQSIALGDIDGDGKPDIAAANLGSNNISVFKNNSVSGSFNLDSKVDFATSDAPVSIELVDLNADGMPELVTASGTIDANLISVLRNADIVTLPVSLVSYQAKLQTNGTIQLNWLIASETNNSHFEVLRSTDGKNFTAIAIVTGAGNSTQQKTYNYIDPTPASGENYYKLLQYDNDGKQTDLGVRAVNVTLGLTELLVYPNPASSLINISFDAEVYQKLELIDLTGKILVNKAIGKQESSISLDISKLAIGIYNIRLTGEGKLITKQVIKQ